MRLLSKIRNVVGVTADWWAAEWASAVGSHRHAAAAPCMLLLAWHFPPIVSGGTYRPLALVRHTAARGWRFVVVGGQPWAPPDAASERLLGAIPPDTVVGRVPPTRLRYFFTVDGGFDTAFAIVAEAKRRLAGLRPKVVIASGPPFTTFVAGRYLARAHRVPLILDYRDEWTECPVEFVAPGRYDRWWERRCLADAAMVMFTTPSQREHALRMFPGLDPAKVVVIPNGWDPEDGFNPLESHASKAGDRPTLAFIGNIAEHHPPDEFLDTLAAVLDRREDLRTRVTVAFVGQKSPSVMARFTAYRYPAVLKLRDQVPKDEAVRLMRRADALLILNDRRLLRTRPGKIYEYFAARRPILAFGEGGEVARLVGELNTGVVVASGDDKGMESALDSIICRPDPPANPDLDAWLQRHTRAQLTQDMIAMMAERIPGLR